MELQALELEDTLLVAALVVLTVQRCQTELEVPVVADKEVIKQVAAMALQILAVVVADQADLAQTTVTLEDLVS